MLKMLSPPTLNIADARDRREDWASSVSYLPRKALVIILFYVSLLMERFCSVLAPFNQGEQCGHLVLGLNIQFKVLSD